jgi:outer membrane protein
MKKVIFLFLALLAFANAYPQKQWSLEECINYAYENNLQIKRSQLSVDYNKNNYNQSKFNTLPNLNGQFSHSYSSGKALNYNVLVENNQWASNAGLSSELTVFNGLQIFNNIQLQKYLFMQSQADMQKVKNDISLALTLAYLQILFDKELVDVAKSKLEVTSLQAERTKRLVEVGNLAQGEYFEIKAQEAIDKLNHVNALNNLDIAYLNLNQMLDLDSLGGFEIVVPELEIGLIALLENVDNVYTKAVENMPQIKSAEYALKGSEKQRSMAWGQLSPNVSLNGYLSSQYFQLKDSGGNIIDYPYKDQMDDNFRKQISLNVSVPIFNRFQVKKSISNSKIGVMDSKLALDQAKLNLYKEIQQAHADAVASMEKYNSSLEAVKSNQEAFKYTQQKFEVGLVNSVDFNISKTNLLKAESDMLQAKYEYIFKLKILDFYMGNPIVL